MALSARDLIRLLEDARGVDEWIATETRIRRVGLAIAGGRPARMAGDRVLLGAVVFRDTGRGRGSFRLSLDGDNADREQARALIAQAAERATFALGPAWALPAPAAPARVVVDDPGIAAEPRGAVDAAAAALGAAARRLRASVRARIGAQEALHAAETSRGFASQYRATAIDVDVDLGAPAGAGRTSSERIRGRARRSIDLQLERRMVEAARAAADWAEARPLEAGRYDLLISPSALVGPPGELDLPGRAAGYGWFAPLVAHASAEWVRLGLSRYRPGQPIFGARPTGAPGSSLPRVHPGGVGRAESTEAAEGDPFTLASDGTLPFAEWSAPFGELGEPVRRFELARAGVAAGLALDYREAALARTTPNGGVRNLVLAPGAARAADLAEPGRVPLIEIDRLAWLDVDPRSGALTAGIGRARVRTAARDVHVLGGILVGNAFPLLARARLSAEVAAQTWYRGPAAIRIDDVELIGP